MTRRAFLALAAAATATAATIVSVADKVRPESVFEHLRRFEGFGRTPLGRLQAHYAWLRVDPAAFESYLEGYQRVFGPLTRFSLPRGDFYTRFLLSTDFFDGAATRAEAGAAVQFTGFYWPPDSPCYNPLAQPPPTDEEIAAASRSKG